jgi:glucan phosphoethanolaminetransferase (alkaline phosphatase superfamily)
VSVYVDDMRADFGRMKMCHMLADSHEELVAMADRIGVQRKWIQNEGTPREHFDIALSKRALAIQHGAQLVGFRKLAEVMRDKRAALGEVSP